MWFENILMEYFFGNFDGELLLIWLFWQMTNEGVESQINDLSQHYRQLIRRSVTRLGGWKSAGMKILLKLQEKECIL